jgi:transcriptional regulator with XRE-family HTH domain
MNEKITGRPRSRKAQATETVIGDHIAQMRTQLGLTLDQLATATGFTKSYLSKIENSKKVPPIGTLSRIARALKTDITEILRTQENGHAFCVVRVKDRQPVVRGGTAFGYDYQSLAHTRAHKRMEPFLFTFPSEIDKYVFFEHEGEEFIFVLSGKVEWQAGGEKVILQPGDSIYFDSRLPHRGRALGGEATALVVAYSPEE